MYSKLVKMSTADSEPRPEVTGLEAVVETDLDLDADLGPGETKPPVAQTAQDSEGEKALKAKEREAFDLPSYSKTK